MKRCIQIVFVACLVVFTGKANAQNVGINTTGATPNASAGLDVDFTNKGFLMPRVALTGTTDVATIASPATSLLVYNTATAGLSPNNVTPGFYFYNGVQWERLQTSSVGSTPDWTIYGNNGTSAGSSFIGTTDNVDVVFKRNNTLSGWLGVTNASFGYGALPYTSSGSGNVAFGVRTLTATTNGAGNVAVGYEAGKSITSGSTNIAIGSSALNSNLSASSNVAIGTEALYSSTSGNSVAIGAYSMRQNVNGSGNVALGTSSLYSNVSGSNNVVAGDSAMFNSNSSYNTAIGKNALLSNVSGSANVAIGALSLKTTTGSNNVAVGYNAGSSVTSGNNNICIGYNAQVPVPNGSFQINIGDAIYRSTSGYVGIGTSNPVTTLDVSGTEAIKVPVGTTAQRPATPVTGMIRFNTDLSKFEGYDGTAWVMLN